MIKGTNTNIYSIFTPKRSHRCDKTITIKSNQLIYFSTLFRVQFIQDYTLKSMRLKPEKWVKLVISDEQRRHLENFVYKGCPLTLLSPHTSVFCVRSTASVDHLAEYWGAATDTHRLAQSSQEQGGLLREEARQAPAGAGGGPPGLHGLWGHPPQHSG